LSPKLTTFEAVARRLPMALNMLTEPMPQELGTIEILVEAGLAQAVRSNDDLIEIIEKLHPAQDRQSQPLPKVHSLDRVDAIYEIAQTIFDMDNGHFEAVSDDCEMDSDNFEMDTTKAA
jgi:hypothetical protein